MKKNFLAFNLPSIYIRDIEHPYKNSWIYKFIKSKLFIENKKLAVNKNINKYFQINNSVNNFNIFAESRNYLLYSCLNKLMKYIAIIDGLSYSIISLIFIYGITNIITVETVDKSEFFAFYGEYLLYILGYLVFMMIVITPLRWKVHSKIIYYCNEYAILNAYNLKISEKMDLLSKYKKNYIQKVYMKSLRKQKSIDYDK
ncbi:hypothetical protein SAM46_03360 [Mycoplasmopsis verecunda]|uniref:hypothetical protein n=1 Tax=Mycoplasmopsis verecunda TaxID=171291 RepID=UPI00298BFB7D|nr:hypothetical protein [Mycoplasmopsis verecunda]WPB54493.1 hypothetical protein SAM46_03360 [Mycoplasmopsis verecunda]